VQEAKVDPVVFQIYYSISIFYSSWLVLLYNDFVFTYLGVIGAALWVPASILSIAAINNLGMSIAVGTWAGVTIVVSFVWGVILGQEVKSITLSIVALLLLIIGILGLSLSSTSLISGKKQEPFVQREEAPLISNPPDVNGDITPENPIKKRIIGFSCAILLGLMNGSMMVPTKFLPENAKGINYVVSFSIGVVIVTPICAVIYFLIRRQEPVFHIKVAFLPGLITGLLWSVGNFCSIYATMYLGLTVGFPLTQLALVVAGLWGLIVFKELSGARTIAFWFLSVLVLLSGAALLALYG